VPLQPTLPFCECSFDVARWIRCVASQGRVLKCAWPVQYMAFWYVCGTVLSCGGSVSTGPTPRVTTSHQERCCRLRLTMVANAATPTTVAGLPSAMFLAAEKGNAQAVAAWLDESGGVDARCAEQCSTYVLTYLKRRLPVPVGSTPSDC
jgi:hypothetical protein